MATLTRLALLTVALFATLFASGDAFSHPPYTKALIRTNCLGTSCSSANFRPHMTKLFATSDEEKKEDAAPAMEETKSFLEDESSLKEKIKAAGLAGFLSYGAFELFFWIVSVPLAVVAYHATTGEWPDFSTTEGKAKVAALSTGFLTFARLAVPVRIAIALALTPSMDKFLKKTGIIKPEQQPADASSEE
mmetsp:Transcript_7011/g.9851  ORF Transcript_7011/g.9851 Transcript_7011/m.9851 type:complete len:191 (+) Transcript_7011:76-648(+)